MNRQTFAWDSSRRKRLKEELWLDWLWLAGLTVAALLLFCVNLDNLPLRDWDEGTIAQVAKEIAQAPAESYRWLFPTLWGEPYFNKPPLMHNLIAILYSWLGVSEWATRFPGAFLTALSVPLLYAVGREIFPTRTPAWLAALIYLTLLPMVRHGRLAMLDGTVVCFSILMFWAILRSRRDLRWALGIGIGFGLLCLTKGMVGLLMGVIALLFLLWDTPRILTSVYLWSGILVGSLPIFFWYGAQLQHYGEIFAEQNLWDQFFVRIYTKKDEHGGPIWYYILELFKYSWPWLFFSLAGLRLSWQNCNWGWAKLILVWFTVYLIVISLMVTKLPWYILPIYPALALAGGIKLDHLYNLPALSRYSIVWKIIFSSMAFLASFATVYFAFFAVESERHFLALTFFSLTLTMGVVTVLVVRGQKQFIGVLFWGLYLSLLLFFSSPFWNWELNEAYEVKPVAAMIMNSEISSEGRIYTSFPYERPSLNFYSNHRILPGTDQELLEYWQNFENVYLLVERQKRQNLQLNHAKILGTEEPWLLLVKEKE